jgi:hypothetical protein
MSDRTEARREIEACESVLITHKLDCRGGLSKSVLNLFWPCRSGWWNARLGFRGAPTDCTSTARMETSLFSLAQHFQTVGKTSGARGGTV